METPDDRSTQHLAGSPPAGEDQLFALVYDELRRIARRHLRRERNGHTLCTTALVHECYLNLAGRTAGCWESRAHFYNAASRAMRHILTDYARQRNASKRGGGRQRVTLDEATISVAAQAGELLALDGALTTLASHSPRMALIVENRFFGGLTVSETAEALALSIRTVEREWTRAKAYLYRTLHPEEATGTD